MTVFYVTKTTSVIVSCNEIKKKPKKLNIPQKFLHWKAFHKIEGNYAEGLKMYLWTFCHCQKPKSVYFYFYRFILPVANYKEFTEYEVGL